MKIFLKRFALMAVAAVGAVACTEADVEDVVVVPDYGTTLYASVATTPETKVEFEDNGTEGIALTWEVGDEFTLYSGDDKVGTFTCEDAESGIFKGSATLTEGTEYTAKYNEDADMAEQNGDEINNLDAACKMSATFIYGEDETITFEHEMAIMTFVFESEETPSKLIFENGEDVYTILYSDIEPVEGIYTSHIMIAPCEAETRTLTFTLYDSEETAYDIRTVSTSKAYAAGYRYTATVSDLANIAWDGSGTESAPYQISTAAQLRLLSTNVNSGISYEGEYFLMTNNIDLGGIDADGNGIAENEFTAIGNSSYYFKGTFDGGGHEVSGLYINQPETYYQGLFGRVYGATIKNLGVSGSVSGQRYVGGVVGYAYSSTVTACYNTGEVSGINQYVGGVVGSASGTVTACYNTGEVSGSSYYVGGVVGYANSSSTVTACYNTGEVSGSSNDVDSVVGSASGTVTACYYTQGASIYGTKVLSLSYLNSAVTEMNSAAEGDYFTVNSDNILPSLFDEQIVYDGEETLENMTISSLDDLKEFRDLVNRGYGPINATLTTDIDLGNESWTPIGAIGGNGCGTIFDGGGYTISGLYINSSEEEYQGLFGYVSGGTIKNLTVKEPSVAGYKYVGAICGYIYGGEISDCAVEGGTVSGSSSNVGGVVGYAYSSSTVTACYNTGEVSGSSSNVGGVVGYAYSSTVTACYNTGEVSGSSYYVGGVVGYASSSTVTACYNTGEVSVTSYVGGGVVGYASSSTVTACYNTGEVSGSGERVGGVVGYAYSSTVAACYNTGKVSGSSKYVGGVVGYAYSSSTVTACYNTGEVSGSSYVGGVVGRAYSSTTVTACYYLTIDDATSSYGTASTAAEMTASNFVETLNAATDDDYWMADSSINSGYPILYWQK